MMKQKNKIAMLAILIVVAAGIFYLDGVGTSSFSARQSVLAARSYDPLPVENPELQRWKLEASHRTEYKSSGRDLFSDTLPPPPPRKHEPRPDPGPVVPVEPPPPTLPANMKYFGHGTVPNGTAKRGFLTDGEEVFIVAEGDTLLGKFRILKIGNTSLEFEELGSGRRNSTPLEEQTSPPA